MSVCVCVCVVLPGPSMGPGSFGPIVLTYTASCRILGVAIGYSTCM